MNGSLPKHVLNQISEHAVGGFMIFYFNSQNGYPEHVITFDTPVHSLALQKYMADWCDGVKAASLEATKKAVIDQASQEYDEEDIDDDDEDIEEDEFGTDSGEESAGEKP